MIKSHFWVSAATSALIAAVANVLVAPAAMGVGGYILNLGTLNADSYAFGINSSGAAAGYSWNGTRYLAVKHPGTVGGTMQNLGTLGGFESYGYAINDGGAVTGSAAVTGNLVSHAFKHPGTPGGTMQNLGSLGGSNSEGRGEFANRLAERWRSAWLLLIRQPIKR